MSTQIFTDANVFVQLRDEWRELLGRSVHNYVFQTPEFQAAWWKTLGSGELRIITVRDDAERLIGLAPLFLHKNPAGQPELSFVGCVNVSDYLDVIVDEVESQFVYKALEQAIVSMKEWEALYLCSLPAASPSRDWLKQIFPNSTEIQQDVSPYIDLPDSWEAYLEQLRRKDRHEIRRKARRLEPLAPVFEELTEPAEIDAALPDFIALHQASSAEKKEFWDDDHLAFFSRVVPQLAQLGWVRLFFLKIDDKRVASMLVFDHGQQFLLYNSGFDPAQHAHLSPGMVLIAHTIQRAIEERKTTYDFLRGNEQYKLRFGAVTRAVFDISLLVR